MSFAERRLFKAAVYVFCFGYDKEEAFRILKIKPEFCEKRFEELVNDLLIEYGGI